MEHVHQIALHRILFCPTQFADNVHKGLRMRHILPSCVDNVGTLLVYLQPDVRQHSQVALCFMVPILLVQLTIVIGQDQSHFLFSIVLEIILIFMESGIVLDQVESPGDRIHYLLTQVYFWLWTF